MSRPAIARTSLLYIIMLGLISALPPLGIDIGLPALTILQKDLGVGPGEGTMTLTMFLAGFTVGPLVSGPLSDHFGRKPILVLGISVYTLGALGCWLSKDITQLLTLRTLQGLGAGAAAGLPAAIVRDSFVGADALRRQSYMGLVVGIAPLVAPTLGSTILTFGDWRTIYFILTIIGVGVLALMLVGYEETAPLADAKDTSSLLGKAFHIYRQVLTNRTYLVNTGLLGASFGTMFSYISRSSDVFMNHLGASSGFYGLLFAITACGTMAGSVFNGRFGWHIGPMKMLRAAIYGQVVIATLLLVAGSLSVHSIALYATLVTLTNFCCGVVMPTTTQLALATLGRAAGSAAALMRSVQMAMGALAGALAGMVGRDNPMLAMGGAMCFFAVLGALLLTQERKSARH